MGLHSFIIHCKEHRVHAGESVFVVGNESADLDSIISSIVFSYLAGGSFVPVVNNKKRILALRGEVVRVLEDVQVGLDDLIYIDDLLPACGRQLKLVLVDHNEPSPRWSRQGLSYVVDGIIDHHVDAGMFPACAPRIIQACASCISIVTALFEEIPGEAADLILAVLTYDTMNWTRRVTDLDVRAASKIFGKSLSPSELAVACRAVMKEMDASTIPDSSVEADLLLQKDCKLYQLGSVCYAICVVHIDLQSLCNVETLMRKQMEADDLCLFCVVALFRPDSYSYSYCQQLALLCSDPPIGSRLLDELREELKLEAIAQLPDSGFWVVRQHNLQVARKQLQPLVNSLLATRANDLQRSSKR